MSCLNLCSSRIWRRSRSLSSFSIPSSQVTWLLPPLPPRATRCARWSGRGVPHPHFIVTFRLSPIYWAAPAAKYNQWPSRASRSPQVHNWEQNVFWKPFSYQRLIRSCFQKISNQGGNFWRVLTKVQMFAPLLTSSAKWRRNKTRLTDKSVGK